MNLPQGQRGQIVALALLLIVLFLLFELAAKPLWGKYTALQNDIDEASFNLQRYQRIAADLPKLRQNQLQLQNDQPLQPFLLGGQNRALAAAELQRHLQKLAAEYGGRILSARALSPQEAGPLESIALNARLQTSVPGLQQLVHALENGQPIVRIEQISISVRASRRQEQIGQLDVRLTITGLRAADDRERQRG